MLLNVKIGKAPVFVGVEQGASKHKNDILIMIAARMRIAAQWWVNKNYGITVLHQH